MSNDNYIWPVGDLSCDDDDENQGADGIDLSLNSVVGKTLTIGSTGVSAYSGHYTTKEYVEQQINDEGGKTVRIHGDLVVADLDGNDEINVTEFMKTMKDRMLILQPDFEANEHYPALKDAYDQYKMLEKLLTESKNVKKD